MSTVVLPWKCGIEFTLVNSCIPMVPKIRQQMINYMLKSDTHYLGSR